MRKVNYQPGSFFMVPNRDVYKSLKPNAKIVYVAICDYADETGSCYPSRKTLAKDTGISVRSVDGAIKELIAVGVIEKQERKKEAGDNFSNVYQLIILSDEGGAAAARGGAAETLGGAPNDTLTITTKPKPQNNTTTNVVEPEAHGNPDINEMVQIFEDANQAPLRLKHKQRFAAQRIIKRIGREKALDACRAAVACRHDQYAPSISNLLDLDEKLDKLIVYYQRKRPTVGVVT